jgi:SAM-dependent methyltransferase
MAMIRVCPACYGTSAAAVGHVAGYGIRACGTCSTLFTGSLPVANDATDYAGYYDEDRSVPVPEFVLDQLRRNVRTLERYRQLGSWLDIGCGVGTLLRAAAHEGWRAVGTEMSPRLVDDLAGQGLDVRLGATSELDLADSSFDVVSLVEVVEHLSDPAEVLDDAARLVRPGGAVYITTPHGRGLASRLLGTGWSAVAPPEHLQLFSVRGLSNALERSGLRIASVSTHGANPYELVARLRSGDQRLDGTANVESRYALNEALTTRRAGSVIKRGLNAALSALRLGDTLKVVAERG